MTIFVKVCEEILEGKPVDRHFADVLNLDGEDKIKVQEWIDFLFDQVV